MRATLSEEVGIAPITDDEDYTLATVIDAQLGEWSKFHQEHGFYVQGVNITTAVAVSDARRAIAINRAQAFIRK